MIDRVENRSAGLENRPLQPETRARVPVPRSGRQAAAADVLVSGEEGQKFETLANITLAELGDDAVIAWLLSPHMGDPIDRPVRTGQKFGPFFFYIGGIPLGQRDLTLTFANTPPIAFHVTMRNSGAPVHVASPDR